jgi:glycosyltransferase involved in cell wall biosynthesis
MKKRVALVASHVIQYQDPFFRLLAADPEIDLTVLYCSRAGAEVYRDVDMQTSLRWDIELLQGYRYVFLRNFGFGEDFMRLINPGVIPAIAHGHYDAVILFLGWGALTAFLAVAACRASGTPFFWYGDSSHPPAGDTWRRQLRAGILRTIFRLADGFLVSGVQNAEYYKHYGADERRFFLVPWAIDNARFATPLPQQERDALRALHEIAPQQVVFVFSGKLIPRKDPLALVRAIAQMRGRDRAVAFFLGHGELRGPIESLARERGVEVRFGGFVNQTDMPKYYAMSDAFVLPTHYDPRATVINEAMASGLPIVVTDRCPMGDIVQHGDNALVFRSGDVTTLASYLDRLTADPALRARMGARSREIIAAWDYARGVEGVKAALR